MECLTRGRSKEKELKMRKNKINCSTKALKRLIKSLKAEQEEAIVLTTKQRLMA